MPSTEKAHARQLLLGIQGARIRAFVSLRDTSQEKIKTMRQDIHPQYYKVTATCVCGNSIETGSTQQTIRVDVCCACHPFYTGTQKIMDTEGRVEKFKKRYAQN